MWEILRKYWNYVELDFVGLARELSVVGRGDWVDLIRRVVSGEVVQIDESDPEFWAKRFVSLFAFYDKVDESPVRGLLDVDNAKTEEERTYCRWVNCMVVTRDDMVTEEQVAQELFREIGRHDVDWKYVAHLLKYFGYRVFNIEVRDVGRRYGSG